MKTLIPLRSSTLLLVATLASVTIAQAESDSFIKQWQLADDGSRVCISTIYFSGPADGSEADGTKVSEQTVGSSGSYYELWTDGIASDNGNDYLLDTAYVAPYAPDSLIKITSGDPYPTTRTRADEVFKVDIQVTDLMAPDSGAPDSALNVYLQYTAQAYDSSTNEVPSDSTRDSESFIADGFITENGWIEPLTGGSQLAKENDVEFKQRGEDIFRCYAFAPNNQDGLQIAEGKIQVWPIGDASVYLVNYDPDAEITRSLPDLKVTLTDLYPYSTTYLQIYEGAVDSDENPNPNAANATVIEVTRRTINSSVPQSRNLTFDTTAWEKYVPNDGTFTIEVITHTPFVGLAYPNATNDSNNDGILDTLPTSGGLRLVHNTFTVDKTIQFKGSIISSG
jgi:hypothetical protein